MGVEPNRTTDMGLVELLFTVCSILHPTECRVEHRQFLDQGSLMQCMNSAPPYLAQWTNQHEGLRVVKWSCAYPGSRDQEL